MGAKTKKIKAFGRFGAKAGTRVRSRLNQVEGIQRKKQTCPHCNKLGVKRESSGIWYCSKCNKRFAGHAYMLNRQA
jgi:large subunit ribosomal protein L37Ae